LASVVFRNIFENEGVKKERKKGRELKRLWGGEEKGAWFGG